ncbi:hypothetical protein LCGC14_2919400, partial [marine sediment metagenome]
MLLLKLGGSVITNKEKPLSARTKTIYNIVSKLKRIDEPIVIVHGGGSYGHYWSVKFGMHTKPAKYDNRGVAIVKKSMVDLNKIILDSFLKNKLNPYCLPPTDFVSGNKPIPKKINEFRTGDKFKIGSLEVEPIHVDHSVPGAYGFIIYTSEGPVVYTGDIRLHGTHPEMTEDFIAKAKEVKPIALISEGTRIADEEREESEPLVYQ